MALQGEAEGRSRREIAAAIRGQVWVNEAYHTAGGLHSRAKRWLKKATAS